MFFPAVMSKPPLMYAVAQVMPQGTAVKLVGGVLVPVTDGLTVLGFTAQEVINYQNRPLEYTMVPEVFTGNLYDPVMINRPGVLAVPAAGATPGLEYPSGLNSTTTENAATNVGVWNEKGDLFRGRVKDDAGVDQVCVAGDELVGGLNGQLIKKPVADPRPTLAYVHQVADQVGMPLTLNSAVPVYLIRLSGNLG